MNGIRLLTARIASVPNMQIHHHIIVGTPVTDTDTPNSEIFENLEVIPYTEVQTINKKERWAYTVMMNSGILIGRSINRLPSGPKHVRLCTC